MSNISVFGYSLTPMLRFLAFGEVSMEITALGRTGRPKTTARPTTWAASGQTKVRCRRTGRIDLLSLRRSDIVSLARISPR
jgi:hypothetical protein